MFDELEQVLRLLNWLVRIINAARTVWAWLRSRRVDHPTSRESAGGRLPGEVGEGGDRTA